MGIFQKNNSYFVLLALIIFITIISTNSVLGTNYYADLEIKINERGETTIDGITNHPSLKGTHEDLTTKKGKHWVFNLSSEEFSEALIEVKLPRNTVITYIKSTAQISIGTQEGSPFIKGTLRNKPLNITIQYHFDVEEKNKSFILPIILMSIIIIIIGFLLILFLTKNKTKELNLSKRQKEIFLIIQKQKKITQKELEDKLTIPKSSLSRNVDSLVRKELIEKHQTGMTNTLILKQDKK